MGFAVFFMSSLSKFTEPQIFRRFSPAMLSEMLGRHPALLDKRGIFLPAQPDEYNMPYDRIADLFLHVDGEHMEIYDAIHLVNRLANAKGVGAIGTVARDAGVVVPPNLSSPYDVSLWTWLSHPRVLERAGYRVQMHNARSFHYFNPMQDGLPDLAYDDSHIGRFASAMGACYRNARRCGAVKVTDVVEGEELWLMIHHGGHLDRRGNVDEETGDVSTICFHEEQYDVLVYNTRYHELKIRNAAKGIVEVMRMEFGSIFFGTPHTFARRAPFNLEALCGRNLGFLSSTRVAGIHSVKLAEVRYGVGGACNKTVHIKAENLLYALDRGGRVIPAEVLGVDYAKFKFRFSGDSKARSVEIRTPNKSSFGRESDAPLVEQWLRKASILNGMQVESEALRFFSLIHRHMAASYTLNEWRCFLGEQFGLVFPLLRDTGVQATYWCAEDGYSRLPLVREGEKLVAISPDYESESDLEQRDIEPEEVALWELPPARIAERLAETCSLDAGFSDLENGIYRIGSFRGADSRRFRAYMLSNPARRTASLAKQLFGMEQSPMLCMSPEYCSDTETFLSQSGCCYIPMADMLDSSLEPGGAFHLSLIHI